MRLRRMRVFLVGRFVRGWCGGGRIWRLIRRWILLRRGWLRRLTGRWLGGRSRLLRGSTRWGRVCGRRMRGGWSGGCRISMGGGIGLMLGMLMGVRFGLWFSL